MFGLFKKKPPVITPEEVFWNWFLDNASKIETFIDSESRDYSIYHELSRKINNYSETLFPELTKTADDKYVLIITPDGIRAGVEPTKRLAAFFPGCNNWIVEKFRQPSDDISLNFKGLEYPSSDIEIIAEIDAENEVVDIDVFIVNMNADEETYKNLAFLYMDHILGEFNSITKVGSIGFHHLDKGKRVRDSISLLELRNLIAAELY